MVDSAAKNSCRIYQNITSRSTSCCVDFQHFTSTRVDLPVLVDVEHGGEAPLVVVHRNQPVLVEDKETKPRLLEHAVLLLLPWIAKELLPTQDPPIGHLGTKKFLKDVPVKEI